MTQGRRWSRWVIGWIVLTIAVVAYELVAVLDGAYETPTLTYLVVKYIPEEITITFLLWLLVHFGIRYLRRRDS